MIFFSIFNLNPKIGIMRLNAAEVTTSKNGICVLMNYFYEDISQSNSFENLNDNQSKHDGIRYNQ